LGIFPFLIAILHTTPVWFYILPLSLLLPGISIATFSEGIDVDARKGSVIQWFKILGIGRKREIQFSELNGVCIETRVPKNSTSGYLVFDVKLFGDGGSLRAYTAPKEDEAKKVVKQITAVSGLPQNQPPVQQPSTRKLIVIVALFLLLPILFVGLLMIF
jgi:hypothetical protein